MASQFYQDVGGWRPGAAWRCLHGCAKQLPAGWRLPATIASAVLLRCVAAAHVLLKPAVPAVPAVSAKACCACCACRYVKMKVYNPKMGMDALQVRTHEQLP